MRCAQELSVHARVTVSQLSVGNRLVLSLTVLHPYRDWDAIGVSRASHNPSLTSVDLSSYSEPHSLVFMSMTACYGK